MYYSVHRSSSLGSVSSIVVFGVNNLTRGSSFKSVSGRVVTEEFYVTAAASVAFYIRTALIGEDGCSFSQTF
jgi:hypothetical protein